MWFGTVDHRSPSCQGLPTPVCPGSETGASRPVPARNLRRKPRPWSQSRRELRSAGAWPPQRWRGTLPRRPSAPRPKSTSAQRMPRRSGSGGQHWYSGKGSSLVEFEDEDKQHLDAGLRLVALPPYALNAIWQPGAGEQRVKYAVSFDDLKQADAAFFARGLRLVDRSTGAPRRAPRIVSRGARRARAPVRRLGDRSRTPSYQGTRHGDLHRASSCQIERPWEGRSVSDTRVRWSPARSLLRY